MSRYQHRVDSEHLEDAGEKVRASERTRMQSNATLRVLRGSSTVLPAPLIGDAHTILHLQHTAGNAAVQRSIQARDAVAVPTSAGVRRDSLVIQRNGPTTTEPRVQEVNLRPRDIVFVSLPPGGGFMTGTGRNTRAAQLIELVLEAHDMAMETKEILGFLGWTEHQAAARDLEAIEAATPMIAKASRGTKGKGLRESVEAYTQANPKLAAQVESLTAARKEVEAATLGVDRALTDQKLTAAGRAAEAATGELAAHTAKVEKTKKWANKVFEGVVDLVFDPKKVMDVVKGLVKFAGSELIVGPLVEGAYGAKTQELREKVKAAKLRVQSLQDERDTLAVEQAIKSLEAAQATYRAEWNSLVAATREAEAEYATLVEKLEGMGSKGEGAAGALDARALAAQQGADGLEKILQYQALLARVSKGATDLEVSYENYYGMASSPGGKHYVADDVRREQLALIAFSNAEKAGKIARWAASESATSNDVKSYLSSGSYLRSYDKIDSALHEAIVNR